MEEKNCPCCPNHCETSNLGCGRGREYFNKNKENGNHFHREKEENSMTIDEKVISRIRKCGHYLHHSEKEISLEFLTEQEKENLIETLSKCLDNWK